LLFAVLLCFVWSGMLLYFLKLALLSTNIIILYSDQWIYEENREFLGSYKCQMCWSKHTIGIILEWLFYMFGLFYFSTGYSVPHVFGLIVFERWTFQLLYQMADLGRGQTSLFSADLYCVEWGVKLYSNQTKPSSHPSVRSKSITELEALHSKTFGFWIFQFPPDFQILWDLCPMPVTLTESWICPLASIVSCLYDVSVVIFWLWHYCRWCWTNGCHSDAFSC